MTLSGWKFPAWIPDNEVLKSETSVAAAIAAGLAATWLGKRRGMLALFRALATPTLNGGSYLYLTPWTWKLMARPDETRKSIFIAALCDVD